PVGQRGQPEGRRTAEEEPAPASRSPAAGALPALRTRDTSSPTGPRALVRRLKVLGRDVALAPLRGLICRLALERQRP
ncbi:hypothetical protein, partial [Streptomyces shenzhenensis]|uniref:hypothetical protein n=1 Tax=Streptomyces shenzhenensis TaxID=943815 RepID=UPI003680FBFB